MPDGASRETASSTGVADSAPFDVAASKATAGGLSLSSIVYVWVPVVPTVALAGALKVI